MLIHTQYCKFQKTGARRKNEARRTKGHDPSPTFENEWAVRKFYCYKGDELLGFVFFDPFFENGKTIGYTANILRSKPRQPRTVYWIMSSLRP